MQFVRLTRAQKMVHYLFPVMMAAFGLVPTGLFAARWVAGYLPPPAKISAALVFFSAAVISFIKQKWALRFYSIKTNNSSTVNAKITKAILREYGWQAVKINDKFIQATGHGFRHMLDLRTWAELMTFELSDGEIKVNSICNPLDRAQFADHGKNKQNIRDFEILFSMYRGSETMQEGKR